MLDYSELLFCSECQGSHRRLQHHIMELEREINPLQASYRDWKFHNLSEVKDFQKPGWRLEFEIEGHGHTPKIRKTEKIIARAHLLTIHLILSLQQNLEDWNLWLKDRNTVRAEGGNNHEWPPSIFESQKRDQQYRIETSLVTVGPTYRRLHSPLPTPVSPSSALSFYFGTEACQLPKQLFCASMV